MRTASALLILGTLGLLLAWHEGGTGPAAAAPPAEKLSFSRDVRPILATKCLACHGPDDHGRQADLRLDTFEGATASAVKPGDPAASELIRRILCDDADEVMPPASSRKTLTDAQKEILRRWVAEGAKYEEHWAFVPPSRAAVPAVRGTGWARNEIDRFIAARLDQEVLEPSPEADRLTLIRRVSLDLIGLAPSVEEAEAFAASTAPDAYEQLVDRLLASPHYGERWGRRWLDLARYADTNGYEKDRPRTVWPYRDWVIRSLNDDLPFSQFTVEQLAGDMLPGATPDQLTATGFHRNTMLNEEGGIDPLEFRFHAMTDRVATTGTTWLGLTLGCTQCHTHKYDPIQHTEYYGVMALLNNADEPDFELPSPDRDRQIAARRAEADRLLRALPEKWPVADVEWETPHPALVETESGQAAQIQGDQSLLFPATGPEGETVTIELATPRGGIDRLRLDAMADPSLPKQGPGRTPHGNFVLSEIVIEAAPAASLADGTVAWKRIPIVSAEADVEQPSYLVAAAFDGDEKTGWAVHAPGKPLNVTRTATFRFAEPVDLGGETRWRIRLVEKSVPSHTIGRPRISLGRPVDSKPEQLAERRRSLREGAYEAWLAKERGRTVAWTDLRPAAMRTNLPLLTLEADNSVIASGDITKDDTYELTFDNVPAGTTAIRLEALPDDRLPAGGPGLTYYEGPKGDFFLGEFQVFAGDRKLKIRTASESYAKNNFGANTSAMATTDGNPETGWTCAGRFGEAHQAVFVLDEPLAAAGPLKVTLRFGRHYACSLGRFRIGVTAHPGGGPARDIPREIDTLLALPAAQLTDDQRQRLSDFFLLSTPELAAPAKAIRDLREPPAAPATLVFRERPPENPRPTHRHHRGEYAQPKEVVAAGVPAVLLKGKGDAPGDRLAFARWLVSRDNPLTARVIVNRQWSAFFGQGLVRSQGDFGVQGDAPTHPELLDWLACELQESGWSLKTLHRRIVLSATYRQASRITPESLARDPQNRLLSRAPRVRIDAELVRDLALQAAGTLSDKMYGPPVYPPQPAGVTDIAYGGAAWNPSGGEDRLRRGLYTFLKRTAPYAMFTTFDGPTGEVCLAQREVANTPLQALTMLNDPVLIDAAERLGQLAAEQSGDDAGRITKLFRLCVTRPPTADELARLQAFVASRRSQGAKLDATAERSVWNAVARALLNLDETITRN